MNKRYLGFVVGSGLALIFSARENPRFEIETQIHAMGAPLSFIDDFEVNTLSMD